MVKNKDMQFFMENLKMKRKRGKKIWPSLTGIWTPDFSTNSRPKFEIWGRLDLSSPGFLELLDFTGYLFSDHIFFFTYKIWHENQQGQQTILSKA